jgi:hypothetical protein
MELRGEELAVIAGGYCKPRLESPVVDACVHAAVDRLLDLTDQVAGHMVGRLLGSTLLEVGAHHPISARQIPNTHGNYFTMACLQVVLGLDIEYGRARGKR